MPTATDHRPEQREEYARVESDEERTRDEGYSAGKHPSAPLRGSTTTPASTSTSLEGEARPRERTKHTHVHEKATVAPSAAPAEFRYAALRTATVFTEDGTPFVVYEPRRERPVWNYVLPLALLGLGAFYAYQNVDWFVKSKPSSVYEHPGAKPDLRYFDMLQNARVAPRFTAIERISSEDGWLLQMDVPGFARNEINIYSMGPVLTVRGTHTCPTRRNGRQEPMCIERHVFEEVRFPDEADMETAQAKLDHGVLKVNVKPHPGYRPRGRVIQIMDALGEKVQDFGEAVKEKIGLHSTASRSAEQVDDDQHDEEAWNLEGSLTEEQVRRTVDRYVSSLHRTLRVPVEKEHQFVKLVLAKTDGLVKEFWNRALTAEQLRDQVRRAAEEVWEEVKQETARVGEGVRDKASEAYDSTAKAKQKVFEAHDKAADLSLKLRESAESTGHKVKATLQEKVGAAKEKAQIAVDDMMYNAEYARHRAEEAGLYAAHRAGEKLERAQDSVRESAHLVGHLASEKVEEVHDRAKESAHYMRDRASENAERAQDRAREESNYMRHLAEEAAQKAEHRMRESLHHPNAAARKGTLEEKAKPKSVIDALKEKLGWGSP